MWYSVAAFNNVSQKHFGIPLYNNSTAPALANEVVRLCSNVIKDHAGVLEHAILPDQGNKQVSYAKIAPSTITKLSEDYKDMASACYKGGITDLDKHIKFAPELPVYKYQPRPMMSWFEKKSLWPNWDTDKLQFNLLMEQTEAEQAIPHPAIAG